MWRAYNLAQSPKQSTLKVGCWWNRFYRYPSAKKVASKSHVLEATANAQCNVAQTASRHDNSPKVKKLKAQMKALSVEQFFFFLFFLAIWKETAVTDFRQETCITTEKNDANCIFLFVLTRYTYSTVKLFWCLNILMLCAPSYRRRPFLYHKKMADFIAGEQKRGIQRKVILLKRITFVELI